MYRNLRNFKILATFVTRDILTYIVFFCQQIYLIKQTTPVISMQAVPFVTDALYSEGIMNKVEVHIVQLQGSQRLPQNSLHRVCSHAAYW